MSDLPTIIFGVDVTHPQPGEDFGPSIAAVCRGGNWAGRAGPDWVGPIVGWAKTGPGQNWAGFFGPTF